jgi:N utilization substance protein A
MTSGELEGQIDRAIGSFMELEGMTEDLAQRLVEQGYLSYDDLSVIEPEYLMEMGGISADDVDLIVSQADDRVEAAEKLADDQKQQKKRDASEPKLGGAQSAPGRNASSTAPPQPTGEQPATQEETTPPSAPEETMDQSNEPDQN